MILPTKPNAFTLMVFASLLNKPSLNKQNSTYKIYLPIHLSPFSDGLLSRPEKKQVNPFFD